jgi:DNA-binding PadR family transcriptional regulator
MLSTDLKPLSFAVLALVGRGGASAPEIVEMAERGAPLFWTGAASQVYAETRRLAELGYLAARSEPSRTRPRTFYTLTERGIDAFRDWARSPASYPRIQHDASVRVFGIDLLEHPGDVVPALEAMCEEVALLERMVDELKERSATIPHRTWGIGLQLSLASQLLEVHRTWVGEVRAAVAEAEPRSDRRP